MRRNKKFAAITAALALALSMLTACAVPAVTAPADGTGESSGTEATTAAAEAAAASAEAGETTGEAALPDGQDAVALSEEEVRSMLDQVIAFRGDEADAEEAVRHFGDFNGFAGKDGDGGKAPAAWLYIPGTATDLPLYGADTPEDEEYFGTHDITGAASDYGVAYIDKGNTADFTDPNTVVHGYAGSGDEADAEAAPFYSLLAFGDSVYYDEHPYIYICTPDDVLEYAVFITYEDAAEDLLLKYNCYDYGGYAQMVFDLFNRRDMQMSLNEDLRPTIDEAWNVITLEAEDGKGGCRYVMAVLTGAAKLN